MTLHDLSADQLKKLHSYRYDQLIEKHEGPWEWKALLKYQNPEFLRIDGYDVLLPLDREQHENISILRCLPSADGSALTIFLRDETWNPGIDTGFLAFCERPEGEPWYLATVCHEWFFTGKSG